MGSVGRRMSFDVLTNKPQNYVYHKEFLKIKGGRKETVGLISRSEKEKECMEVHFQNDGCAVKLPIFVPRVYVIKFQAK